MQGISETRVYEVERRNEANAWVFVGNLEITNYAIVNSLVERADRDDWPDGEYRLLHWDNDFASGSFFRVTLRSETKRRGELQKAPAPAEAAA